MERVASATVGEVIGWNLRAARTKRGWSQPKFGQEIGRVLPKPWPAQTVSSAEKGERAFAAAELVAIADLLETSVSDLFTPPSNIRTVTVTETLTVPARSLTAKKQAEGDVLSSQLEEAQESARIINEFRSQIEEICKGIKQEADTLHNNLGSIGLSEAFQRQAATVQGQMHIPFADTGHVEDSGPLGSLDAYTNDKGVASGELYVGVPKEKPTIPKRRGD